MRHHLLLIHCSSSASTALAFSPLLETLTPLDICSGFPSAWNVHPSVSARLSLLLPFGLYWKSTFSVKPSPTTLTTHPANTSCTPWCFIYFLFSTYHNLTSHIFYQCVWFIFCLPQWNRGCLKTGVYVFGHQCYLSLNQYLEHTRYSINICRMNEWMFLLAAVWKKNHRGAIGK